MTTSTSPVGVRLRIDIGPDCSIGPGKIALLEQIERSGSLSKAARVLKMSYRRAWLLLEDLNRTLGQPVTTASVGGAGGGGAQITPFGRQVAAAFREIESAAIGTANEKLEWLLKGGVARAAAPIAPRRPVTRSLNKSAPTAAEGDADAAPVRAASGVSKKRGRAVRRP
jgi:molybdate transport system regulatory protein